MSALDGVNFQPPKPTTRFRVAVTIVVDVEAADQWDAQSDAIKVARCALAGTTGFVSLDSTVVARDNGQDVSGELEQPMYDLVERGEAGRGLTTYPEIPVKRPWFSRDRSREGQPHTDRPKPSTPPPGASGVSPGPDGRR